MFKFAVLLFTNLILSQLFYIYFDKFSCVCYVSDCVLFLMLWPWKCTNDSFWLRFGKMSESRISILMKLRQLKNFVKSVTAMIFRKKNQNF